jgi:hypothetical protein
MLLPIPPPQKKKKKKKKRKTVTPIRSAKFDVQKFICNTSSGI